ncbi:hypothetical protein [Pseudomonas viridiflava]|uniref:hypothetical protein n=1 Tax=Pseudomonas viridiflava TaxID=33069 RepID=UPI000F015B75|nr:hypothetical protein [Pseudomonas viridiflava]
MDNTPPPRSARDAILVELIGDVGRLHDQVEAIPSLLKLSMADSLEIIARAVEEAETTARTLSENAQASINEQAKLVQFQAGVDLANAIRETLDKTFEPSIQKAQVSLATFEDGLARLKGGMRDKHSTRLNYLLGGGFAIAVILMIAVVGKLAITAQDHNDTNKWFYEEYKAQKAFIETLPPELRRKAAR